jgi:acyl-CoA synthetase (AMP-forming)/AMP-acid ligase II
MSDRDVPVYPATFWGLVEHRAGVSPDQVLIEDESGGSLTARVLRDCAEQVGAALHARGVVEGTAVSWQLPTTIDSAVLLCALARLGAVQNPIIPILRRREVEFIARQTGAALLITPGVWRGFDYASMADEVARATGCDVLNVGRGELPVADPATLPPPPSGEGRPVRFVYYSSGTTADPKGGRHTDASAMAAANGLVTNMGVSADDRIPIAFPFTHIGGMGMITSALHVGCRLVFIEVFDPVASPLVMAERGATLMGSALPFFRAYIDAQRRHGDTPLFPALRGFISGGAPKPPEIYYELKDLFGVPTLSGWGLTEFPIATTSTADDTDEELAETEGPLVPGVELRVVAPDGSQVEAGDEGELRVRGPQMIAGYVDASLDEHAFDELGFFRTGDLGVVGPRGHVRVTGRLKDIIIRNAENISALEIESVLYEHPRIVDVAVVGVPDAKTGERACAVVVVDPGATLTLTDVAAFCRERQLANQKIPERLEIVDALPRNAMGKVLKQDLRRRFGT